MSAGELVGISLIIICFLVILILSLVKPKPPKANNPSSVQSRLESLYIERAKKHRKYGDRLIFWILLVYSCYLFLAISILLNDSTFKGGEFKLSEWFLLTNSIFLVGLGAFFLMLIYRSSTQVLLQSDYIYLSEKQFPDLWAMCFALQEKMKLEKYSIKIIYLKRSKIEAHVFTKKKNIYLVLSRKVISQSGQHKKAVESIIAHELGHVKQGDAKVLLALGKVLFIPTIIVGLSLIFALIISFIEPKAYPNGKIITGLGWTILSFMGSLYYQRWRSEHLADLASYVFVENSQILHVLSQQSSTRISLTYPAAKERIDFVEKAISSIE